MFKRIYSFFAHIITRFSKENITTQAAGLAYVTLLSLVPLLTLSFAVLTAFPVFQGVEKTIQDFIFANFITSSAQAVQQHIQMFLTHTGNLSATSTLFLLITAVLMIFSMEQTFNHIWQVHKRRNIAQAFLMYWAILTLTPILIGVGVIISSYVIKVKLVAVAIKMSWMQKILAIISPYIFTVLIFTVLYVTVPNCRVKLTHALAGAAIAALLFQAAKLGFQFYITNFPTYKLLYGALAAIPIFLIWLYLSWLIILFGALITRTLAMTEELS